MVYRKRATQRRKTVRRQRYRKKVLGRRIMRPHRALTEISQSRYVKLKYNDTLTATIAAAGNITWQYQTSCFDPYVSPGGHQPLGFDQWALLYYSYRVMGMSFRASCQSITAQSRCTAVAYSNIDAFAVTALSSALERKYVKSCTFGDNRDGYVKGYLSVAKLFGVPLSNIKTEDNFSAVINANPLNLAYLSLTVFNPTTIPTAIVVNLDISYYVTFYRPRSQGPS